MTTLIIDNEYKASEAKADAIADKQKTNEEKAKEVLFTIYGGIKTQYFAGGKTFNLSSTRLDGVYQQRSEVIVNDYIKPTLEEAGYTVSANFTKNDGQITGMTLSISWQTA